VIVHQLCRRGLAALAGDGGALGRARCRSRAARPVQWIPPRWDWVDPLKDIQAQVLAMEAGITSRRKVVEATGYDVEEVDRENAADAARATGLGLRYRTSPGETQGARATPATRPEPGDGAGNDTDDGARRPIRPPNRSDDMASWYAIRARGTGAEVAIYDEIGAYGVSAKGFLAELGALPEGTPVDLRLNSPGGSVFDAVAIHNALKRHEGTVTVWIDGIAASAASYIAMAGDEIVMPENAFLMIHDPAGLVMGTAEDMRAMAEALDKVKGSLVSRLRRAAPAGRRKRSALMAAETWFDAADALGAGFADRLIEPVRIAAALRHRPLPQRAAGAGRGCRSGRDRDPDERRRRADRHR
jgi:ATP-dependent protease ClpP protease subunit